MENVDAGNDSHVRVRCHSAVLARSNLPMHVERNIKGLSTEIVIKRRLKMLKNFFIFHNFDLNLNLSEKYEKRPF